VGQFSQAQLQSGFHSPQRSTGQNGYFTMSHPAKRREVNCFALKSRAIPDLAVEEPANIRTRKLMFDIVMVPILRFPLGVFCKAVLGPGVGLTAA